MKKNFLNCVMRKRTNEGAQKCGERHEAGGLRKKRGDAAHSKRWRDRFAIARIRESCGARRIQPLYSVRRYPKGRYALGCSLGAWSFVLLLLCLSSAAAETFYRNPVIPGDNPDPSVIRVGKDFWATSTSSEWGPQFPLLHSTDLVNWELTGNVFPHRPAWAVANFWAPEISEFQGRYFVYYVGRKNGGPLAVAVAAADNPAGPYIDHGPLVAQDAGSIDPVPVTDEK